MTRLLAIMLLTAAVLLAASRDAAAYLDPGTGSYLLQIALAGILGAGFAIKLFWKRIVEFFKKIFSRG